MSYTIFQLYFTGILDPSDQNTTGSDPFFLTGSSSTTLPSTEINLMMENANAVTKSINPALASP
mgnify:CR=1 FL=1